MDDGFYKAVQEVFVRLYEDGLVYRGKRLVNWDPKLHTAISDLEVENQEEKGYFWHLRYPLADGATTQDGKDYLIVATTRPETMLGDTAVAVHPEDERYQHLVGKFVMLPLVNRRIPVIADHHADPEKGSGCVKITPAHDFNDYAVGKRNNLPMMNVLTQDAKIRQQAEVFNGDGTENTDLDAALPAAYAGLTPGRRAQADCGRYGRSRPGSTGGRPRSERAPRGPLRPDHRADADGSMVCRCQNAGQAGH